jgi:DNA-directed RNA polymerase specialized sigma24 family protein
MQDNYEPLKGAAQRISSNSPLAEELLHYTLDAFLSSPKLNEVLDCGAGRWFCIKIMTNSWKSTTSPFYHTYRQPTSSLDGITIPEPEEDPLEGLAERANAALAQLSWYDRMLFQTFVDEGHTISSLARSVGIPRTSVSLTIKRVRTHIKKQL